MQCTSLKSPYYFFSFTFALSCQLYLLVIFEILDIYVPSTRWFLFKTTLIVVNVHLLIILPFCQFFLFLNLGKYSFAVSILFYTVYIVVLWKFIDPLEGQSEGLFQSALARISVIGVTMNAFLSAYGSINWPMTSLGTLLSHGNDVSILKQRLYKLVDSIGSFQKRSIMTQTNLDMIQMSTMQDIGNELIYEIQDEMEAKEYNLYSKTWKGKVFITLGYAFSVYAIYRVTMSIVNLVLNRDHSKRDPIQILMEFFAITIFGMDIDVVYWYHQTTFVLTTIIIITSIRGFLLQMMKFLSYFFKGISSGFIILFSSQILGMYFTSSLILLRLPFKERQVLIDIFSLQFKFYARWFDMLFVVFVGLILLFLYSRKQLKSDIL
jgi:hypothetical protein